MRYLKYFLVVGLLLMSLAFSTSRTSRLSESVFFGNQFPDIENLENVSGTKMNLSDLRGQKVLVVFWAAYDANSRRDNVLFANAIKKYSYPVTLVSVSFDKSESVYTRTISIDKIDAQYQFLASAHNYDKLFSKYQLARGFNNYLLDEDGMTIGMNIGTDDLSKLLVGI